MGAEREENLSAPDAEERRRQEMESLLAVSRRLMQEVRALAAQSQKIAKEHAELARRHAELVATIKARKRG